MSRLLTVMESLALLPRPFPHASWKLGISRKLEVITIYFTDNHKREKGTHKLSDFSGMIDGKTGLNAKSVLHILILKYCPFDISFPGTCCAFLS